MIRKEWKRLSLLAAALIVCLCGCQQGKSVSEEEKDTVKDTAKDSAAVWEDKWTAEFEDGNSIPVEMKCEINAGEKQPDSVVDVQPFEINSQSKERMAKAVFGDAVYLYDLENMCQADLQKRLAREEAILKKAAKKLEDLQEVETEEGITYKHKTTKELKGRVDQIKKFLKTAPEQPVPAQDGEYTSDSYMGLIDEVAFRLEFNRDVNRMYDFYDNAGDVLDSSEAARTIELLPVDAMDFAPEEFEGTEKVSGDYFGISDQAFNDCKLSEEEAEQKAVDMLQKLGFTNMVKTSVSGLAWKDVDSNERIGSVVNGYVFYFQTGVEGNILNTIKEALVDLDYGEEMVQVQVADKGVVRVIMDAPIQVDSITPDVKLLELKDIEDILRTQMPSYVEEYQRIYDERYQEYLEGLEEKERSLLREDEDEKENAPLVNGFKGTYLQRVYCRINNPQKEWHYTFIPAWELTGFNGEKELVRLYINAIDGGFITLTRGVTPR